MAKVYEMLSGYKEFVKAGISYIVNLEHIESLNAQELQMDNGRTVYLPRGSYQSLKSSISAIIAEKMRIKGIFEIRNVKGREFALPFSMYLQRIPKKRNV